MITILVILRITVPVHLIEIDIIMIETILTDQKVHIIELDLILQEDIEILLIIEIIKVKTISFLIILIDKDTIMVIRDNHQTITEIIVGPQEIIDLHLEAG